MIEVVDAPLIVAVGNALRGDDGAALEVARRLRSLPEAANLTIRELETEAIGLLDLWAGAHAVVLVDTVRTGAPPGTLHRLDAAVAPLPAGLRGSSSTHAVGVGEAIELGRALGRLPGRLVLLGVEGRSFATGAALSAQVAAALDDVVAAVLRETGDLR